MIATSVLTGIASYRGAVARARYDGDTPDTEELMAMSCRLVVTVVYGFTNSETAPPAATVMEWMLSAQGFIDGHIHRDDGYLDIVVNEITTQAALDAAYRYIVAAVKGAVPPSGIVETTWSATVSDIARWMDEEHGFVVTEIPDDASKLIDE